MGFKPIQHPAAWLAGACLLLVVAGTSHGAERVALVIGNAAYVNAPTLANPRNDAVDVAAMLASEAMGFEVVTGYDLGQDELLERLIEFGRLSAGAEIALVFYAGHAIQVGGRNYLIPVDAPRLHDSLQLQQLLDAQVLIDRASAAGRVGIVLLDACRDNPFAEGLKGTRTVSEARGLGALQHPPGKTLVMYATAAGEEAEDVVGGNGRNSPFTTGLLKHLATPGLEVLGMFRRVIDEVDTATLGKQRPDMFVRLGKDRIYLAGGGEGDDPAREAWAIIKAMSDGEAKRRALTDFIERYSGSPLVYPAELALSALTTEAPSPVISTLPTSVSHVSLTVYPEPSNARVRILNIERAYHDGIELIPGKEYDIEISAPGYETYRDVSSFSAGYQAMSVLLWEHREPSPGDVVRDRLDDGGEGPEVVFVEGRSLAKPGSPFSLSYLVRRSESNDESRDEVDIQSFYMMRNEVSYGEYIQFAREKGQFIHEQSVDSHPVVNVGIGDAEKYAQWLTDKTGHEYRLPTVGEWLLAFEQNAARYIPLDAPERWCGFANLADQSLAAQGYENPILPPSPAVCSDGVAGLAPVGSFTVGDGAINDLVGNVFEMVCLAWPDEVAPCDSRKGAFIILGGAWDIDHQVALEHFFEINRLVRMPNIGFRLVRGYARQ